MTETSPTGAALKHPATLQLWYAWPGDLAEPAVEDACTSLLSDAERARAARFHFARHRREYLATHALARTALSHAHPLPPRDWTYSVNAYGKPAPIPECGLRFNQSHSVELVVCLIAHVVAGAAEPGPEIGPEIGIDIEAISRAEQIVRLAPEVFSPAEQAQLHALPAAGRRRRALSLWTLKEAYIKARGMGLSLPLRGISFLFGPPHGIRLDVDTGVDDDPARWRFCLLDHNQHRIALVVDRAIVDQTTGSVALAPETPALPFRPPLEIFTARPPFAAPTRLPSGFETWFPLHAAVSQSRKAG